MVCNLKYAGHGANFDSLLHYLEPDIVLKLAETQIIVDAKYKSYLYHKHSKAIHCVRVSVMIYINSLPTPHFLRKRISIVF